MLQATASSGIIFREQFISPQTVAQNGWVLTGNPTINRGVTCTSTNAQRLTKNKVVSLVGDTKGTMRIKFKAPTNVTSTSYVFGDYDGVSSLNWLVAINLGYAIFYAHSATESLTFPISAGEEIDVHLCWDSTQSTSALRGVVYRSGVAFTPETRTFGAGAMSSIHNWVTFGYGTSSVCLENAKVYFVKIWKGVQLTAEEVSDDFQNDTIPELDRPLIDLPLRSSYYKETGTQLLVDGDMEAADTSAYSVSNVTATKEAGFSGGQCLRLAYDGSHTSGGATQSTIVAGKRYHVTGQCRVSAAGGVYPAIIAAGAFQFAGATALGTQEIDFIFTNSSGTSISFSAYSLDTGRYVEYDNLRVELLENLTENTGTLGGTAKLGDGSTTTTLPTQVYPHGWSFDGGDYGIVNGSESLFTDVTPFTWIFKFKSALNANPQYIFGNLDASQGYKGVECYVAPATATVHLQMLSTGYTNVSVPIPLSASAPFDGDIIITHDGTHVPGGMKIYINGVLGTQSVVNQTLSGSAANGMRFLVGARWTNSSSIQTALPSGFIMRRLITLPFVVTPQQASILHNKLVKENNL